MKVALEGVTFGQVAWTRAILGGLTLGIVLLISRQRLPRERAVWGHFLVIAITGCVVPFLLFSWAEQYVSSSLASIYNAVTPIMTALVVTLGFRVEKLSRSQLVGIVLGVLGVLLIIGPWQYQSLTGDLWGQLACLGATLSYGVTFGYTRKFLSHRNLPGTTMAFMNIGLAGLIMLLLTPVIAWHPVQLTPLIVGSLVLLGALGTGFAYVWNFNVLQAWGPTVTSTVTYITPVVGVVLGVLLLGEGLSWHEPLGAVLVLIGILFAQRRLRLPSFGAARAGRESSPTQ
jgi:drug/metabolite transporter (DMT)-like permease